MADNLHPVIRKSPEVHSNEGNDLEKLREEVERSSRLITLGTITAAIAHEYNNLLTPVISYAELALKHSDNPELINKSLNRVLQNAQRAAEISESLLGFARSDEMQKSCDVAECVDVVLKCLARDPKKDNININLQIPESCTVAISSVGLEQVLLNLILNAIESMKKQGGGTLTIMAVKSTDKVVIRVQDTGTGIPEDMMDTLFEPFVTRHENLDSPKGTGLGLAICREILERRDSSIHVASKPGEGACFEIIANSL